MGADESKTPLDVTTNTGLTSIQPEGNMQTVENMVVIWLDSSVDNGKSDCLNTINQLECVVSTVRTYTDSEKCLKFMENMGHDKACIIVSGTLGKRIVPRIHAMSQVESIFIFCHNRKNHEQWTKQWSKIMGVFTQISSICESIKISTQDCDPDAVAFNLMATPGDLSQKSLNQLDPMFMYSQIVKEILLVIRFDQQHFKDFIQYCQDTFHDNIDEIKNVNKLERDYRKKTPIWWYTYESFLYHILNNALRQSDFDLIIKMGFFIGDLHRQIEKLHKKQFTSKNSAKVFTAYRGMGMSSTQFKEVMETKGGLLSFNNFLSVSTRYEVSLAFAERALRNQRLVGVLLVMTIDPSQSTTPFATVADVGAFGNKESEILFSMHTIFRIHDIKPMNENPRLFRVEVTLTNANDKDLRILTNRIREETYPNVDGWRRLGLVLLRMGQPKKAENVYQILLEQETLDKEKAPIYNQLGWIKDELGEYQKAITFYEKALEIYTKTLPPKHPNFGTLYNNIGLAYYNLSEYLKALSSLERALKIKQKSRHPDHPDLAVSYNNIGLVYQKLGQYTIALLSHENALAIRRLSLPPNHPNVATSYSNIGLVYEKTGNYSEALLAHENALLIRQKSLPPNHPDLAVSYSNIASVHFELGEYSKALSFHEKSLEIRVEILPSNHPDLAYSYNNVALVCYKRFDYFQALSCHERALAIRQTSLPPNHPDLAASYSNVGLVQYKMGEYAQALLSHQQALWIRERILHSDHPDLAGSYNNVGDVYRKMGEYEQALSSYEKAFEVQQSLPPIHPDIACFHTNMGRVYYKMGEYSKALLSYEKSLEIRIQTLPSYHPDLAHTYNNIGLVYFEMNEYSNALSFHEKALGIRRESLPPNHPDLATSHTNIGTLYFKMGEYLKALRSYEDTLEIRQRSLTVNHPDLSISYQNIGSVYETMNDYTRAMWFYERAIESAQKALPSNHPTLQNQRKDLERVKNKLK